MKHEAVCMCLVYLTINLLNDGSKSKKFFRLFGTTLGPFGLMIR